MKRLITASDVVGLVGGNGSDYEPFIDIAHALVCGYLDTPSLIERAVPVQRYRIPYDLDPDDPIVLRDGPVTQLSSLVIHDKTIDLDSSGFHEDVNLTYWSFKYYCGIRGGRDLRVGYIAGFTPQNAPFQIKTALIFAASMVFKNPTMTTLSEKIGDYAIDYRNGGGIQEDSDPIDVRTRKLLHHFRRPRL